MDWQLVNMTAEAVAAIRSAAIYDFKQTGTQRDDGTWDVPLEAETVDGIREKMLPGETISDAIIRIVATAGKPAN